MAAGSPDASEEVWATKYVLFEGNCDCAKYVAILPSVSRPYCFTTPTTPTMVMGFLGSNHKCFPTASPLGQNRLANFSSMMTTEGRSGVSRSEKNRPARRGIFMARK